MTIPALREVYKNAHEVMITLFFCSFQIFKSYALNESRVGISEIQTTPSSNACFHPNHTCISILYKLSKQKLFGFSET